MGGGERGAVPENMVFDALLRGENVVQQSVAQDLLAQASKPQKHNPQPVAAALGHAVQPLLFPEQPGRGLLRAEEIQVFTGGELRRKRPAFQVDPPFLQLPPVGNIKLEVLLFAV